MFQVIFNEISAAEISQLSTTQQLELLTEFKVTPEDLESLDGDRFGRLDREGKILYRFRSPEYRIYFEVTHEGVIVHRVLHKNTLEDFLFRTKLDSGEDAALAESKQFWELIEEGEKARRV
jgi:mRNA-degrading endonuclease RelE of RelBE toxin-antitoxin system